MGKNKIIKNARIPVKILLRKKTLKKVITRVGVGAVHHKGKDFEICMKSLTLDNGYVLGKEVTSITATPDPLIWKITTKIFEVAYAGFIYLENREGSDPIKGYKEADDPLAVYDGLPFFYGYPEGIRERLYYRVGTEEDKKVLYSYLEALEESRNNVEPILFDSVMKNPFTGKPIEVIKTDPEPVTPENWKRKVHELGTTFYNMPKSE